jgi:predicted HTH domain antitoxin
MQDLIISGNILEGLKISPAELMIDIAVYLYDKEKLSMGQAKKLAGLTQIEFQKELSKNGVLIKYDIEDFEKDLKNLFQSCF